MQNGEEYKIKNSESVKADKIFTSLVMKHRLGQLSDDNYFDEVVAKLCDWELPQEFQEDENSENSCEESE